MRLDILKALNAERAARRAAIVVTDVASGAQRFVKKSEVAADPLRETLDAALRSGKSGMAETPQGRGFLNVHVPPPAPVGTGAGPISPAPPPMRKRRGSDRGSVAPGHA